MRVGTRPEAVPRGRALSRQRRGRDFAGSGDNRGGLVCGGGGGVIFRREIGLAVALAHGDVTSAHRRAHPHAAESGVWRENDKIREFESGRERKGFRERKGATETDTEKAWTTSVNTQREKRVCVCVFVLCA